MKICFVSFPLEKNIEAQEKLIKKYGNFEPEEADFIVALGGDGFILKSLHNYMKLNKPIYGMNFGSVGFLMNDSEISDIQIYLSQIKVTKMSYEEADKSLHENISLSMLNEIAKDHKKFRDSNGSIRLDLPKTDIKVKDQKVLVLPQLHSESREMVSEMMVIAGRVIAHYSIENNVSMPYLSQAS